MKILTRLVLKIMLAIASKSPFTSKYLNFQQIYKSTKMATNVLNSKHLRIFEYMTNSVFICTLPCKKKYKWCLEARVFFGLKYY